MFRSLQSTIILISFQAALNPPRRKGGGEGINKYVKKKNIRLTVTCQNSSIAEASLIYRCQEKEKTVKREETNQHTPETNRDVLNADTKQLGFIFPQATGCCLTAYKN